MNGAVSWQGHHFPKEIALFDVHNEIVDHIARASPNCLSLCGSVQSKLSNSMLWIILPVPPLNA
jgi:hypothetical protein